MTKSPFTAALAILGLLVAPMMVRGQARTVEQTSENFTGDGSHADLQDHSVAMACWGLNNTYSSDTILSVGDIGTYATYRSLQFRRFSGDMVVNSRAFASGGSAASFSTTGDTDDKSAWYLALAQWVDDSTRNAEIFKNEDIGQTTYQGSNSNTMAAIDDQDTFLLGGPNAAPGDTTHYDGELGGCAVWGEDIELIDARVGVKYALGQTPRWIAPNALIAYWPLREQDGTDDAIDYSPTGTDLTVSGTVSPFEGGPRPIYFPGGGN